MQGKGLITAIALILGLICVNELLPTFYASNVENQAMAAAGGNEAKYKTKLEELSKEPADFLYRSISYQEAKEKEMKLGLDLKGGINVLLEINQRDLVNNLTNYSTNPFLIEVLNKTDVSQRSSSKTYIDDFFVNFEALNKAKGSNIKLANPEIFGTQNLSEKIKFNTPDDEVKKIIKDKISSSVGAAYEVIRTRIDKLGVTQPNVQRVAGTARILVEMPGIKDIDRVKKLLQTSARLQFWEVQELQEVGPYLDQLSKVVAAKKDSLKINSKKTFMQALDIQSLRANGIGSVSLADTAMVNKVINSQLAVDQRPANLKFTQFMWGAKTEDGAKKITLYAIRGNASQKAPLDGAVSDARVNFDQMGKVQIDMQMDTEGTKQWKTLTQKNVGKAIAVTLDNRVYTAPNVNEAIPSGRSQISGNFSQEEAQDLVDVLKSGRMPASAKIVQAEVVGPSLGKESIDAGIWSFIAAFVIIMIWIVFYYGGAGIYAVIAMVINLFYVFGIMDSMDATLTLPGIAGMVLSMAMAVDTNVIIYERTKEELFAGKSIRQAYTDGFKHALPAIIDGHVTTLLTAVVLYVFGTGPIKGFAVTLIIGLLMTFFTSVLISRVMIFNRLDKNKGLSVWTSMTKNWFRHARLNFIAKRKTAYVVSTILMVISLWSIFTNGFKLGVDFQGGRNYVVRLDKAVDAENIKKDLAPLFATKDGKDNSVEVKTYGSSNQIKIVTDYKINDNELSADQEIEQKLFEGLKKNLPANYSQSQFKTADKSIGIISSTKVGPTVADDLKSSGTWAIIFCLAGIFVYILIRFNKWQFSLGAVAALFHDAVIILGAFSLFYNVMPFNMEINQDFIAAILTVLGYSINDTVIVFDRIREYLKEKKALSIAALFDDSISSTLGRTFNTSFTTILVILAIFIFGGDNMKGFMFAMLLGIGFGTYSSIFIASALSFDFLKAKKTEDLQDKPTFAEVVE
jgi:SecD/SecF fusion protein